MIEQKVNKSCVCVKCGKNLFEAKDNKIKIRTNIIVFEKSANNDFDSSIAVIKCSHCKADNQVPLLLDTKDSELKLLVLEH